MNKRLRFLNRAFDCKSLLIFSASIILQLSFHDQAWGGTDPLGTCNLSAPTQLVLSGITACSANLSWKPVLNASYYKVKFKLHTAATWSAQIKVSSGTSYTFTDLNSVSNYDFSVAAFCSNNGNGGWSTVSAYTISCGPATVDTVSVYDPQKAYISWEGCSSVFNQIRYRLLDSSQWIYAYTTRNPNIDLQNLITGSKYVFQVNSCQDTTGNWSAPDTFAMKSRPNILLIIIDDARFDTYSCNGAPSWFSSPNIDRIANEGANFKDMAVVYSFCAPSRGSIVSGLYPHNSGAFNNSSNIYPWVPTAAKILDSAGYYVGWVGKYHMAINPQPGYNYWIGSKMNSGTSEYWNLKYNCNGKLQTINGHDTNIVTDSSLGFFNHVHHQNFFLSVAYHAPHPPYEPQPQYIGRYKNYPMPIPSDTARYTQNYPSFLYELTKKYYLQPDSIAAYYELYYEMIAGVDSAIGLIFNRIQQMGEFDNTMVIFTSDNGRMIGEHGFFIKFLAYETSIKVPLFIRYPAWFQPGVVFNNFTALNVDITPTILQAAGISTGYHFDGLSLPALISGQVQRPQMYYEYLHNGVKDLPSIRAVRDSNFIFINYLCKSTTQEFFDIKDDPQENNNLIFNPTDSAKIAAYKADLADLKAEYTDNYKDPVLTCSISNPVHRSFEDDDEDNYMRAQVFPDPAADYITVGYFHNTEDEPGIIRVTDNMGRIVFERKTELNHGDNEDDIGVRQLPDGIYDVWIIGGHQQTSLPFVVNH